MVAAFARSGADVVVVSRRREACEEVVAEVRAGGGTAVARPCHVGHWDELEPLVSSIYDELGRIDILVNNAGSSPLYGRLSDVSEDLWDKTLALNLKGPFRLTALVGERMAAGSGGSIINVSSIGAISPSAHELPYAAAKAGVNALAGGLARAYGPTVRVNTIMPGPFLTDISRAWDMDAFEEVARTAIPLQRGGRPDEIVGAALFLAGDESAYVNGSTVTIDGGMTSSRP